jgi:hypothetical protein
VGVGFLQRVILAFASRERAALPDVPRDHHAPRRARGQLSRRWRLARCSYTVASMGLFGPKRIVCRAGQWTALVDTAFAQLPKCWQVRFEGDVRGELEERKSKWVFPGSPTRRPLEPQMILERGYWNTFYRAHVRPDRDVVAIVD